MSRKMVITLALGWNTPIDFIPLKELEEERKEVYLFDRHTLKVIHVDRVIDSSLHLGIDDSRFRIAVDYNPATPPQIGDIFELPNSRFQIVVLDL